MGQPEATRRREHPGDQPVTAKRERQLDERLLSLLRESRGRDLAAALALCATSHLELGREVRDALHAVSRRLDQSSVPVAIAANLCSLLADGFPISETLLIDLASFVGTDDAVRLIVPNGPTRERSIDLVHVIAAMPGHILDGVPRPAVLRVVT